MRKEEKFKVIIEKIQKRKTSNSDFLSLLIILFISFFVAFLVALIKGF